jgi:hypothetical protein
MRVFTTCGPRSQTAYHYASIAKTKRPRLCAFGDCTMLQLNRDARGIARGGNREPSRFGISLKHA